MNISGFFTDLAKSAKSNAPELLSGAAIAGVISTSYLAAKATAEAAIEQERYPYNYTRKDLVKLYWKRYIPAAVSGVLTVGAIVGSGHASGRRTAAAVTALTVTERALNEYKAKVVQQIGIGAEQKIRDQLVQEQVTRNPPSSQTVIHGTGRVLFCEMYTGRYFWSDMETLQKAVVDVNRIARSEPFASLTEFYDRIGLKQTSQSDYMVWLGDTELELEFSAVEYDEGPDRQGCMGFYYNYLNPLT